MDLVAKRVGVTVYAGLMAGAGERVKARREERRGKRRALMAMRGGEGRERKRRRKGEGRGERRGVRGLRLG